jgi:ABC-type amino acid transport substrate-binding protein
MLNRYLSILSALAFGLALSATNALAADNQIQEIKNAGVLRMCMAEGLPSNMKNPETQEWEGYNVDMGNHLAEVMGVEPEYVDATWGTIIAALKADKCDLAMVGLFRLAQRAEVILFSNAWGFNTMIVVAREDRNFGSMEDINNENVTLASISGTAEEEAMRRYFPKAKVRSVVTDKLATVFLELAAGRADAMLIETTTARIFMKENSELKIRDLGWEPINPQGYSYAIAPGEYHFQQFINVWMERTETSGLKAKFWKKWNGPDSIPGKG